MYICRTLFQYRPILFHFFEQGHVDKDNSAFVDFRRRPRLAVQRIKTFLSEPLKKEDIVVRGIFPEMLVTAHTQRSAVIGFESSRLIATRVEVRVVKTLVWFFILGKAPFAFPIRPLSYPIGKDGIGF